MSGTNSVFCCCLYIWMNSKNWDTICLYCQPISVKGFPGGSDGKESACSAGDLGSIPGLGRSPGEGNGYPLQYSGLENSMDRTVHGSQRVRQDWVTFTFHFHFLWYLPNSRHLKCVQNNVRAKLFCSVATHWFSTGLSLWAHLIFLYKSSMET